MLPGVKLPRSLPWLLALTALAGCTGEILPPGPPLDVQSNPGPGDGGDGGPTGSGQDGGSPDAGRPPDAGLPDGGSPDAGRPDAGLPDAGAPDSGVPAGRQRFPASSTIYQDISGAALASNSQQVIDHLAAVGWGTGTFQIDFSITVLDADPGLQPRAFTPASGYYTPDCDQTTVPVPPGGNIEGSSNYTCNTPNGDCHLLVYQGARLYELYNTTIAGGQSTGSPFTTICEVVWDLTHDYWQSGTPYSRGDQCTSADAAGLPIAPLLVTGAELQGGLVPHALRFILPNPRMAAGVYVHPATHAGAPSGDALYPPYGARLRLRSTFDLTQLPSAAARAVAVALQKYGMILADGGNVPLTFDSSAAAYIGSHDLGAIQVSDFEMVASPDPAVALTYNCTRTPITQ